MSDILGAKGESGGGEADAEADAEAERKTTMAMIMRTPEGKMWKAERRR